MENKNKFSEYLSVIKSPFPPTDLKALWVTDFSNEESRIYSYGPNGWLPAGDASEGTSKISISNSPSLILTGNGTPNDPLTGTVPVVTTDLDGLMLSTDKIKLDRVTLYLTSVGNSDSTDATNFYLSLEKFNPATGQSTYNDASLYIVTSSRAGIMSAADKTKLDNLINSPFRGDFPSVEALTAGVTDPRPGDYAYVTITDEEGTVTIVRYIWNQASSNWIESTGTSTEETPESIMEKYESNSDRNAYTDAAKTKVDNIVEYVSNIYEGGRSTTLYNLVLLVTNPSTGATTNKSVRISPVNTASLGLMLPSDKIKLNNIDTYINNIELGTNNENTLDLNLVFYNTVNGNSTNTALNIPLATSSLAGVISATDKLKLDALVNYNLSSYISSVELNTDSANGLLLLTSISTDPVTGSNITNNVGFPTASPSLSGVMTPTDKIKLNRINSIIYNVEHSISPTSFTTTYKYSDLLLNTISDINIVIPESTTTNAGLLSALDKVKLNSLSNKSYFVGQYSTIEEIEAVTTGEAGLYATLKESDTSDVVLYVWDSVKNKFIKQIGENDDTFIRNVDNVHLKHSIIIPNSGAFVGQSPNGDLYNLVYTEEFNTGSFIPLSDITTGLDLRGRTIRFDTSKAPIALTEGLLSIIVTTGGYAALHVEVYASGVILYCDGIVVYNETTGNGWLMSEFTYPDKDLTVVYYPPIENIDISTGFNPMSDITVSVDESICTASLGDINVPLHLKGNTNRPFYMTSIGRKELALLEDIGSGGSTLKVELDLSDQLDGSVTTFTVPDGMIFPELFYNGLRETLNKHYTISGTTLTINFNAPRADEELLVTYFK